MGQYKLTWEDVYDYLRCPKIPAFKAMGLRAQPIIHRRKPKVEPYRIGRLGEKLAEKTSPVFQATRRQLKLAETSKRYPRRNLRKW